MVTIKVNRVDVRYLRKDVILSLDLYDKFYVDDVVDSREFTLSTIDVDNLIVEMPYFECMYYNFVIVANTYGYYITDYSYHNEGCTKLKLEMHYSFTLSQQYSANWFRYLISGAYIEKGILNYPNYYPDFSALRYRIDSSNNLIEMKYDFNQVSGDTQWFSQFNQWLFNTRNNLSYKAFIYGVVNKNHSIYGNKGVVYSSFLNKPATNGFIKVVVIPLSNTMKAFGGYVDINNFISLLNADAPNVLEVGIGYCSSGSLNFSFHNVDFNLETYYTPYVAYSHLDPTRIALKQINYTYPKLDNLKGEKYISIFNRKVDISDIQDIDMSLRNEIIDFSTGKLRQYMTYNNGGNKISGEVVENIYDISTYITLPIFIDGVARNTLITNESVALQQKQNLQNSLLSTTTSAIALGVGVATGNPIIAGGGLLAGSKTLLNQSQQNDIAKLKQEQVKYSASNYVIDDSPVLKIQNMDMENLTQAYGLRTINKCYENYSFYSWLTKNGLPVNTYSNLAQQLENTLISFSQVQWNEYDRSVLSNNDLRENLEETLRFCYYFTNETMIEAFFKDGFYSNGDTSLYCLSTIDGILTDIDLE